MWYMIVTEVEGFVEYEYVFSATQPTIQKIEKPEFFGFQQRIRAIEGSYQAGDFEAVESSRLKEISKNFFNN